MSDTLINIGMYAAYVLTAVATLAAILFPVIYMAKHPKDAGKTLLGIAGLAVIIIISYLFATENVLAGYEDEVSPALAQWIGGGIITAYILTVLAVLSIIYSEISNIFR